MMHWFAYSAVGAVAAGIAWHEAPWEEWREDGRDTGSLGITCLVMGAAWPLVALMWCGHHLAQWSQNRAAKKRVNHTCRDVSPQLGNNSAASSLAREDGLGPNHESARKETCGE